MKNKKIMIWVGITLFVVIALVILMFLILGKKEYEVTFILDGEVLKTVLVEENKKVERPTEPSKEGYEFDNWYLDNEVFDFDTKIIENIRLIGKWNEKEDDDLEVEKEITVSFDTDGGSTINPLVVQEDGLIKKPANPTKKGYTFVKWQLDGKDFDFNTQITKNITLTAVWEEEETKYTVTFDTKGGSTIKKQSIVENEVVVKPTNPTKTGYTFVKWQLDDEDYDFNTKITKNITLTAVWEAKEQYTVSFNSNGGSDIKDVKVYDGDKLKKPTNPTRSGYTFVKWQLDGNDYNFNNSVTKDITLSAVWKEIVKTYTYIVLEAGSYSPSRYINLLVDGKALNDAKAIYYPNGSLLSKTVENGSFVVSKADLEDLDANGTIKIELSSGQMVQATKK